MKNAFLGYSFVTCLLLFGAGLSGGLAPCVHADAENASGPLIQPWRQFTLDPDYSGAWIVAGDLDGDGQVEIVSARKVDHDDVHYTSAAVAQSRGLYDGQGRRLATFAMDENDDRQGEERLVLIGDFSGDGVPDVLLTSRALTRVYIYKNEHGKKPRPPAPLGTEKNFTLY